MSPAEQTCNPQRIDDYLANELSEEQQAELEVHLSNCQACRQQLERRAAEPDVWSRAARFLSQCTSPGTDKAAAPAQDNRSLSGAWKQPMLDSQAAVVGRISQRRACSIRWHPQTILTCSVESANMRSAELSARAEWEPY